MKTTGVRIYDYHCWANHKIFDHLTTLPATVYRQEVTSVFPSVAVVIAHIYRVDGMWLSVMKGDPFEKIMEVIKAIERQVEGKSLSEMRLLYDAMQGAYQHFFDTLGDLNQPLPVAHPQYGKRNLPAIELVQHVVNHGTYHRGNITAMLRQQGYVGVPTDYAFFLFDDGGPAANQ